MRGSRLLLLLAACVHRGPSTNEAVGRDGHSVAWRAPIATAALCKSCAGAPTVVVFGEHLQLSIPSCYPHAHSVLGDRDHVSVERLDDKAAASAGVLDIEECTTTQLKAHLEASWTDGRRVEAVIDTALTTK